LRSTFIGIAFSAKKMVKKPNKKFLNHFEHNDMAGVTHFYGSQYLTELNRLDLAYCATIERAWVPVLIFW
jgi:hypothetical protein